MSLYAIAAARLTRDNVRHPGVSWGQATRTAAFCLTLAAIFLVAAHHGGHTAESGFNRFVEGLRPQAHRPGVSRPSSNTPSPA